jgi:predicted DNA-binding ribbon-helix-helix protein
MKRTTPSVVRRAVTLKKSKMSIGEAMVAEIQETHWLKSSTRKSGFSFSSDLRLCDVQVAKTKQPAALPERTPVGASSTTIPEDTCDVSD